MSTSEQRHQNDKNDLVYQTQLLQRAEASSDEKKKS